MSGIEEISLDIPRCPRCNKIPYYWAISGVSKRAYAWLYSNEYKMINNYSVMGCMDSRLERPLILEEIYSLYCLGGCYKRLFITGLGKIIVEQIIQMFNEALSLGLIDIY